MKVLNKMDNDVTYTLGKEQFTLLRRQENEIDKKIAEHPVFKMHLKNGAVEVLGDEPKKAEGKKADSANKEEYRQELLKQCKEKGLKVNPNTGIEKLEAKLKESK